VEKLLEEHQEGCLSELDMDRLLAGEHSGMGEKRHHLQECTRCKERFDALLVQQKAAIDQASQDKVINNILQAVESKKLPRLQRPLRWLPATAAAAAVCLLVVFYLPETNEQNAADTVHLKGGNKFEVLQVIGESVRRLGESDQLKNGDQIAFQAQSANGSWIFLVNLSEDGELDMMSWDGKSSWSLPENEIIQLPLSAQLDDSNQDERIFAFFCKVPVEPGVLIANLERVYPPGPSGRRDISVEHLPEIAGCSVKSILIRRVGDVKRGASDGP
jgi:hypothetical protein